MATPEPCVHPGVAAPVPPPSRWELADVLRLYGESYRQTHPVSVAQQKVMEAIMACRTAQLGGHAEQCPQCGFERYAYNSCRNRHCPKCQTVTKAQWVEARRADLLPTPYFHTVLTLPHELNPLILGNKRLLLGLLFRGKFLGALQAPALHHALCFTEPTAHLRTQAGFAHLIAQLYAKDWVVYAKRPFKGPEHVLEYIGRYTHRVAISNNRIVDVRDGHVRFTYRNRRQGDQLQTMELPAHTFIQRFLLHLLPAGFVRIRHYGVLANRCKAHAVPRCRQALGQAPDIPVSEPKTAAQWMQQWTGIDITRCPQCGHQPLRRTPVPVGGGTAMPRAP